MATIHQKLTEGVRLLTRAGAAVGRRTATDLGFCAVLFTFVAIAYAPSLKHPPRADQWCFLTDTVGDQTFLDTLRNSYSYNRTRQTVPGDTDLFRPLLFALLAVEKCAFGGNLALAQGFGIVLHCTACVLFLVAVRRAGPALRAPESGSGRDALVYAAVTFFALNPCVQELVIWHHLHGYLLFLLFVLGSMIALFRFVETVGDGAPSPASACAGWGLTLLAAFTYELGQFYALMAGALLAIAVVPRTGLLRAAGLFAAFAAIAVIYQTTNAIDLRVHEGRYRPDNARGEIVARALKPATLTHAKRYGVYTSVQPFFPALIESTYTRQRLDVAESLWNGRKLHVMTPAHALSCTVVGAAGLLALAGVWGFGRAGDRRGLFALALVGGVYAAYAGMTVLGRMNLRPIPEVLSSNSYYAYTALLFGLLGASVAWQGVGGAWSAGARKGLAVGLLLLAATGAERVWQANVALARAERKWVQLLRTVHEFVDAHRGEPGFSFAIDYPASDPVPTMHDHPITQLVFNRYMTASEPRYRVVLRDGKVLPVPARERAAAP